MTKQVHIHRRPARISRRAFLKTMGVATASLVITGCQPAEKPTPPLLPAVPTSASNATNAPAKTHLATVAIMAAETYDRAVVRHQVEAALDALGGLSDVIRPGAAVAIKVNLTGGVSSNSSYGNSRQESYWTHPEVAQALGELLLDAGAKSLYFVESVYDSASYPDGGFTEVAQSLGATLVNLNKPAPYSDFYSAPVGQGWFIYESFPFNRVLDNVDIFVSIPKLKCHYSCGVTASMKNLIGLAPLSRFQVQVSDNYRHAFHNGPDGNQDLKARLPRIVIDLNRARPIHLSLIDAITTIDGGEGPWVTGTKLKSPHVLIAGKNSLAADAVGTAVMGFDPTSDYPQMPFLRADNYLNLARTLGLGTNRLEEIEIKGVPIADVQQKFAVITD